MIAPVQRLHNVLAATFPAGATPSISMADLGSPDEVAAHAPALARHPLAPYAAKAIADSGEEADQALIAFVKALPEQESLLALHDTCDILLADTRVVRIAGGTLHDALVPSSVDRVDKPLLSATRLEAALRLSLLGVRPPWRILATLTDDVSELSGEHCDRLPRLIGVFLDAQAPNFPRTDLISQLERLVELDADDALAELGAQELSNALGQGTVDDVRLAVLKAAALLDRAAERDERRDCEALAACARAVVAFADRDFDLLRAAARSARAAAEALFRELRGSHVREWTAPRRIAQSGWLNLAAALDAFATELEHDAFLDTTEAIATLAEAYGDIRTVSPAGHAAAILARPRIEIEVAERSAMVSQLRRAVAIDALRDRPILPFGIAHLVSEVKGRASMQDLRADDDPAEPDPPTMKSVPLAELLPVSQAEALLKKHPESSAALESVAEAFRLNDILGISTYDPVIALLEERLLSDLEHNDYFTGVAKQEFWHLCRLVVRFVRSTLDHAAPYLRPYGKKPDAPHERELQTHLATWIAVLLPRVHMEVRDLGTGRVDVLVGMPHGSDFVIEIKRELVDARKGAIEDAYLGQTLEYQGARLPLGGLLVLDLTEHGEVTPHISDLLWVAHRRPAPGSVTRTALCGVVVGNRPPPSQVMAKRSAWDSPVRPS